MRVSFFLTTLVAILAARSPALHADETAGPTPIVIDQAAPELRHVRSRLWAVAFAPDGKSIAVTSGWDNPKEPGELVVWDLATKRPKLIVRQDRPIPCASISSDGKRIAIGDFAGVARILDAASGKTLATLPKRSAIINAVAFLPEGKSLAAGSFDGTITLWDVADQKEQPGLTVPGEQVVSLATSADGKYLAATTWEGNAHVWRLATRKLLHAQRVIAREGVSASGVAQTVAFASDGKRFATGSADHSVRIWNTESGKEILTLAGHTSGVQKVAFAPDEKTLASSDARGTVRLWDAKSGVMLAEFAAHRGPCFGLAFSPDGTQLATTGWDRTVKIWDAMARRELAALEREETPRE
jgi:WD40 repeat protein